MSDLGRKLGVKAGMRVLALGAPEGFALPLPEGAALSHSPRGEHEVIVAFVGRRFDVEKATPAVVKALADGGRLWMVYPKRSAGVETDIHRDAGWDALHDRDYHPVSQVAVDETWTALRFKRDPALGAARAARASKLAPRKAAAKKGALPKKVAAKKGAVPKKVAAKKGAAPKQVAAKKGAAPKKVAAKKGAPTKVAAKKSARPTKVAGRAPRARRSPVTKGAGSRPSRSTKRRSS